MHRLRQWKYAKTFRARSRDHLSLEERRRAEEGKEEASDTLPKTEIDERKDFQHRNL